MSATKASVSRLGVAAKVRRAVTYVGRSLPMPLLDLSPAEWTFVGTVVTTFGVIAVAWLNTHRKDPPHPPPAKEDENNPPKHKRAPGPQDLS